MGVVETEEARGLVKIAKPVGVVAALIPTTGPDATPPLKALFALKGRNAIVMAPHPRTAGTTAAVVGYMREACEQIGAPADLVQMVEAPSITKTQELMRAADLIVATGGAAMVQAAYSSGTPAYGVGVGNSVHVVDETADLDDAAAMVAAAKTFDYATSCLADNAVVAEASVLDTLRERLVARGGYMCTPEQKAALRQAMWPDGGHIPTLDVVAQSGRGHRPPRRVRDPRGRTVPHRRRGRLGPGSSVLRRETLRRAGAVLLHGRDHRGRRGSSTGSPATKASGTPAASTPPATHTSKRWRTARAPPA